MQNDGLRGGKVFPDFSKRQGMDQRGGQLKEVDYRFQNRRQGNIRKLKALTQGFAACLGRVPPNLLWSSEKKNDLGRGGKLMEDGDAKERSAGTAINSCIRKTFGKGE